MFRKQILSEIKRFTYLTRSYFIKTVPLFLVRNVKRHFTNVFKNAG